jgi:hypothetical protein
MSRLSLQAYAAALLAIALATTCGAARSASAAPAAGGALTHRVPGDFDGDGKPDLAIGAPGHDYVRISYSTSHGGSNTAVLTAHAAHVGPMGFGAGLAVGDFNGDGYADLAVAAPEFEQKKFDEQGAVFLFAGGKHGLQKVGRLMHQYPASDDGTHEFGAALAAVDVNGDGFADLAVSQPLNSHRFVAVFPGSAHGLRAAHPSTVHVTGAYALAFGDVNGDGHPDLVLGLPYTGPDTDEFFAGNVDVVLGSAAGLTSKVRAFSAKAIGAGHDAALGSSLAIGDVNGDGFADVVAGAPDHNEIAVLLGSRHGLHAGDVQLITQQQLFTGPTHYLDDFGSAVAAADVTRDGRADVVVGASGAKVGAADYAGRIFFLRGSKHGLSLAHHQVLTQAGAGVPGDVHATAQFGAALYLAQLAGSRSPDLLVGAPNDPETAHAAGFVVRLLGTPTGLTTRHSIAITHAAKGDQFGAAID